MHPSMLSMYLLADSLDRTVKGTEQTSPNTKVSTEDGGAGLDCCEGAYPALTVGAVSESLDTVPDSTTNGTHTESSSEITEGYPGAGVACVIHGM